MAGYGTDEAFATWMTENGYSLSEDTPDAAVLRQRGSSYIDATYGPRFTGVPADPTQDREWPRTGAYIFGTALADSVIPNRVVEASYRAAYIAATNPGALSVVIDPNRMVKRQKVDTIEREFFEPGAGVKGVLTASVSSDIEGLLAPLLTPVSGPAIMVV
ncbi:MAG: DnaT-like ssDNA-binding protein [Mesorhizobium sp.]